MAGDDRPGGYSDEGMKTEGSAMGGMLADTGGKVGSDRAGSEMDGAETAGSDAVGTDGREVCMLGNARLGEAIGTLVVGRSPLRMLLT